MSEYIYQNFYIKAPIELLEVPLPLKEFTNEEGEQDNIIQYLARINHTVKRYSSDGYFLKGFGFNIDGLDNLRTLLPNYGLTEKVNFFILSPGQVSEELSKDIWNDET